MFKKKPCKEEKRKKTSSVKVKKLNYRIQFTKMVGMCSLIKQHANNVCLTLYYVKDKNNELVNFTGIIIDQTSNL